MRHMGDNTLAGIHMKFIRKIKLDLGMTRRGLARKTDIDSQKILYYEKKGSKLAEFLSWLCRLRKISGLSWSAFGKLLDDEFIEK